MRVSTILAAAFAAVLTGLFIAPASAQAVRTWVSATGDDSNPCSRTSPCRTFAGALSKTATAGEINCVDSGGPGGVTITRSVSIVCEGVVGGVLVSGINVNAPGGIVVLRGLDLNGANGTSGASGIVLTDAAELHVENCTIRNYKAGTASGILFTPAAASQLFVSDTVISSNGGASDPNGSAGIQIQPTGTGSANVELERVLLKSNVTGLRLQGSGGSGTIQVTARDSVVSGSAMNGIEVDGGAIAAAFLEHVASVNNTQGGVIADGANASIVLSNSQITGNGQGDDMTNGANIFSYGNNQINGNNVDGPAPTLIPLR